MPISRNIHKFDFTGEDSLPDEMIVRLNVLGPGMEDWVLCKLDVVEVVAVYGCQFARLHSQILQ